MAAEATRRAEDAAKCCRPKIDFTFGKRAAVAFCRVRIRYPPQHVSEASTIDRRINTSRRRRTDDPRGAFVPRRIHVLSLPCLSIAGRIVARMLR